MKTKDRNGHKNEEQKVEGARNRLLINFALFWMLIKKNEID